MKKVTKDFVIEGMQRYKQASMVMVNFGSEVETMLQNILRKRKDWGPFVPDKNSKATKSTKYWSQYPLLNAKIQGKIGDKVVIITLEINWYQSDNDYPFYAISISPEDLYTSQYLNFAQSDSFEALENKLRYYPDPDNFNPERDFNLLLDEFVRFMKAMI